MPVLAVQLSIGDYAKWRPVFDKHKHLRDKAGMKSEEVYRSADNPKEIMILFDVADVANARKTIGSEEIKRAMQEAGVVGSPKVHEIK